MAGSLTQNNGTLAPAESKPVPKIPVPLLDVGRQNSPLRDQIDRAIGKVLDSGRFVLGPECGQLEQRIASYSHAVSAVGCASGSDALLLALMCYGIGPGDEVILPSYTFFATASAVWRLGAKPVFVDIDPVTFNIDSDKIEQHVNSATKAILPVHLFGQCAEMEIINQIAQRHSLPVIEDAAQAIGAEYDGQRAGSLGDIGCFSFYPTKNLGGMGDAGMLTTKETTLADRLRLLAAHGMSPRYYHSLVGLNSRLDTIQAAVIMVKLTHLDRWAQMRRNNAEEYEQLFRESGLDKVVTSPTTAARRTHVWNQYIIRVPASKRDELREHLQANDVGSEIYYPIPLHLQECFQAAGYAEGDLPESERAAKETIALPIFPELTREEQIRVVECIGEFFNQGCALETHPIPRPKFLKKETLRAKASGVS